MTVRLVIDEVDAVRDWVAERLPEVGSAGFDKRSTAIGVHIDGEPIAGAVYHNFREYEPWFHNIEMSFAAVDPRWALRGIISHLLGYPLIQLRCCRITANARESNTRARKLFIGLGFVEEATHEFMYGRENGVVHKMTHPLAARWIKGFTNVKEDAERA